MDPITARALLQRYLEGDASQDEVLLVEQWYQHLAETGEFSWEEGEKESREKVIEQRLLTQINAQQDEGQVIHSTGRSLSLSRRMVSVAAILLLAIAGAYLLFVKKAPRTIAPIAERYHNDVNPGRNAAVLTLAGGKEIVLDSSATGIIGKQGNTTIANANGRLTYTALHEKPTELFYNTLTTHRGNQYHLTLPDGTKVWLNAASSITFPSVFSGEQRKVTISGEVYFEVAKNEQQPFVVQQGSMVVQVLGTSFDVNGYGDETAVKTTLLEGKVRIEEGSGSSLLAPGQQAVVGKSGAGSIVIVDNPDLETVMAWKNGSFAFRKAGIEAIMQQVERWYDVQVVYEAKITTHFVADIPRDVPLSQLLKLLEETDLIHFRIDGKKIIVTQ